MKYRVLVAFFCLYSPVCLPTEQALRGLKDPTEPLRGVRAAGNAGQQVHWIVQGIFHNPESVFAVVNGQVVRVGDRIDGAIVNEIGDNRVLLTNSEKRVELYVRQNFMTPLPVENQ